MGVMNVSPKHLAALLAWASKQGFRRLAASCLAVRRGDDSALRDVTEAIEDMREDPTTAALFAEEKES